MTENRLSRLGPLSGVLFVVLEIAGSTIAGASGRPMATLGDPTSKIVSAFAGPVGTGAWVGAYLELVSLVAFALFAAWLFQARRGPLASAGLLIAGLYMAVIVASLIVGDVLDYRAGHGMGAQQVLALFDIQSGFFIVSWGIGAAFLALAPVTGWLRRSALAVATLSFVGMAVPQAGPGQFGALLFFVWTVAASVVLGRRGRTVASTAPATASA